MALILRNTLDWYNYIFYDVQDYRTRDWFPSGVFIITILTTYCYFCISLGPRLMQHRKPFQFKKLMLFYNIFQIVISLYIFCMGTYILSHFNLFCSPVDHSDPSEKPILIKYHNLVWLYELVKLIDLLDTVFFVLRKKGRQISNLHLFHHCVMPICGYVGLKYFPNGQVIFLGVINSFVHTIMYTYYMIAGLGPKFQKYLWWKRYLTILQLFQFFLIFLQNVITIYIDCDYPKWVNILLILNSCNFMYMFGSFYYENYVKKDDNRKGSLVKDDKEKRN